jgi:hypothetical protein
MALDSDTINLESPEATVSKAGPREPRVYKAPDSTVYIEIIIKKSRGKVRTGWY